MSVSLDAAEGDGWLGDSRGDLVELAVCEGDSMSGELVTGCICMLVGRRRLGFAAASWGTRSVSSFAASISKSAAVSSESKISGDGGRGIVRAAGGNGAGLEGAPSWLSTASRSANILECLRGSLRSI